MPVRIRGIGPEVSIRVAANLRRERTARGWTRSELAGELAAQGYALSAATILHIELGITGKSGRRARIVSVDELSALARVLGVTEMTLLGERE